MLMIISNIESYFGRYVSLDSASPPPSNWMSDHHMLSPHTHHTTPG